MRVSFEPFWLPKAGNASDEYEDAFWPKEPLKEQERVCFCCAVADGATETSFSGLWADQLVRAYCEGSDPDELVGSLPRLRSAWSQAVDSRPLAWYAEQKAQSGAFAALLGLQVTGNPDVGAAPFLWRAVAIGDACLVQMRGDELVASFPLTSSEQFGFHPFLICSRPPAEGEPADSFETRCGECYPGDTLYLMTDALACWFLSRQEQNGSYDDLRDVATQRRLDRLVKREREERDPEGRPQMRNDDVTLIRLVVR